MPHQVSTESSGTGVVVSFSGVVTADELLVLNAQLIAQDSYAKCHHQVWDFSKATRLAISDDDLRSISVQDIHASAINPRVRVAIVGDPAFFEGKDRTFERLEEALTAYRPKFFSDFETARDWASSERP